MATVLGLSTLRGKTEVAMMVDLFCVSYYDVPCHYNNKPHSQYSCTKKQGFS